MLVPTDASSEGKCHGKFNYKITQSNFNVLSIWSHSTNECLSSPWPPTEEGDCGPNSRGIPFSFPAPPALRNGTALSVLSWWHLVTGSELWNKAPRLIFWFLLQQSVTKRLYLRGSVANSEIQKEIANAWRINSTSISGDSVAIILLLIWMY